MNTAQLQSPGARQIRALMVAHSAGTGGAETLYGLLARRLDRSAFAPVFVLPMEGPLAEKLRQVPGHVPSFAPAVAGGQGPVSTGSAIGPVRFVKMKWWLAGSNSPQRVLYRAIMDCLAVVRLVRLIRREKIDLVYTSSSVIFAPAVAAAVAGVPHVLHMYEYLPDNADHRFFLGHRAALRLMLWLAKGVIACSDASREQFGFMRNEMERKVVTVLNPVDMSVEADAVGSQSEKDRARAELGLSPDDFVVCFAGTLCERKAPGDAVEIIRILKGSVRRAKLLIVGSGNRDFVAALKERVSAAGLGDRTVFAGFRKDFGRILSISDVFLIPAVGEALAIALLDAMLLKLPVVGTNTGGTAQAVVHGKTGFLVGPHDCAGTAVALERLAGDAALRRSMGEEGRKRVLETFGEDRWVSQVCGILAEAARCR